jgi:glycosyltransferase involved in cell wall biosynthesis
VLRLPYPNIDYIIIDGASTDGTVDIIDRYKTKLKYWISEPDKGIYDAMNKGWTIADDKSFIIYLGAGDYILQLPEMLKHLNEDIIYGKVWIGDKYLFDTKVDFRMRLANAVHHQALLIRKSIHYQPPFSLKFPIFADFDFNQRLFKKGFHFKKDSSFYSFAMEGGVSYLQKRDEMLLVVAANYGNHYVVIAKIYYFLRSIKELFIRFLV